MYLVKQGFKHGKGEDGKPKFYKAGDEFPGGDRAKELEAAGLIASKEKIDLENLQAVEKAIDGKKAELAVLEKQAALLRSKGSPNAQAAGEKHSHGNKAK